MERNNVRGVIGFFLGGMWLELKNWFETMATRKVPKRVLFGFQISMVLLVGGNHTSSRFCTR